MSLLPKMDDQAQLAENFNNFFSDKIANIMTVLKKSNPYPEYIESDYITTERFTCFTLTNQTDLMKMISQTVTKSCELDPINTNILKENVKRLAPALVDIVNTSLEDVIITENLKSAMVRLLLKKSSLPLIFKNFRPVSKLSYLSKLIEYVVCEQIMFFAEKSGNLEKYQSAYRPDHSMETALLKVRTDLLAAMDHKEVTCLILLDLSVALDMVDHQLLLNHLRFRFGMEGKCLEWIESYLTGRNQQVVIGLHQSSPKQLGQGVPWGSILGPILYTLYMLPLGDICR